MSNDFMTLPPEIAAIELKNRTKKNIYQDMMTSALVPMMLTGAFDPLSGKVLVTKDEKRIKTCFLKSCKKEHNQRGAFCCVEHQKEWRHTK